MTIRRRQRGFASSLQWAVLSPLVLLMVMGIIQLGLWAHGRTVALDAAMAGAEAEAAALANGSGQGVAHSVATQGGLDQVEVTVSGGADDVTVLVRGRMPSFVDVGVTHVEAQVTRAKEKVTNKP